MALPPLTIKFNPEKNLLLKATRQTNFDDALEAISKNQILDDLEHPNKSKYPHQKILILKINNYAHVVPYIINRTKKEIFLKTIYSSRTLTNRYLKIKNKK